LAIVDDARSRQVAPLDDQAQCAVERILVVGKQGVVRKRQAAPSRRIPGFRIVLGQD